MSDDKVNGDLVISYLIQQIAELSREKAVAYALVEKYKKELEDKEG